MPPSHLRPPFGRYCSKCDTVKPLSEFHGGRSRTYCKPCTNSDNRASYYRNKTNVRVIQRRYEQRIQEAARGGDKLLHAKLLIDGCRSRAKRYGVPCTITYLDIPVPDTCPVLGIPLVLNRRTISSSSATVDRINPTLGYVPGNVLVVSLKANLIKNSATASEVIKVGTFYATLGSKQNT